MGQNRGFRRRRVEPAALVSFRTCVTPFTRRELTCCFLVRGTNVFSSTLVALALILSTLVVATPAAHAQAQTAGEITGQVLDLSKAAIPNAAVTATNSATGAVRTAQTDSQGHYALTDLPVGTYSVTVEHEGFQQLKQTGVMVNVATTVTLNLTLTLGSVKQEVVVTSEAPVIDKTDASTGTVFDNQEG